MNDAAAPRTPARDMLKLADLVQPGRVRLSEDAMRVLTLHIDGRAISGVEPLLAFPVSQKTDYVSFVDGTGKEVALVASPGELDADSRRILEEWLERVYYVPKIERVDSIVETHGISRWCVFTDRGYATFEVVDRDRIRRLSGGKFIVCDADGNRYEIVDMAELDERSQALLESET